MFTKRNKKEAAKDNSAFDKAKITWMAPEYLHQEKGLIWYIGALVFTLAAIAFGIYFDALTFSLAILTFAVVYYFVHNEKPRNVEVKLSEIGIKVGNRLYPYSRIKAFWLIYEPPFVKTLNIRVSNDLVGDVVIQLDGQDPASVREFLINRIPEIEGKTESTVDILLRLFKI